MSAGKVPDINSVILLKEAYMRRLKHINQDIRNARKLDHPIKQLSEQRKLVNKNHNLLVQIQAKFNPDDQTQNQQYRQLLDLYQND